VFADPQLTSWFHHNTAQYARIRRPRARPRVTTWTGQTLPAYPMCKRSCTPRTTSMSTPAGSRATSWDRGYLDAAKTQLFPNKPTNQKRQCVFHVRRWLRRHAPPPRAARWGCTSGVAHLQHAGWLRLQHTSGSDRAGHDRSGIWERRRRVAELPTFDPANAHQPGSGQYHMHINPLAALSTR